jgi:hypothetical protein
MATAPIVEIVSDKKGSVPMAFSGLQMFGASTPAVEFPLRLNFRDR